MGDVHVAAGGCRRCGLLVVKRGLMEGAALQSEISLMSRVVLLEGETDHEFVEYHIAMKKS